MPPAMPRKSGEKGQIPRKKPATRQKKQDPLTQNRGFRCGSTGILLPVGANLGPKFAFLDPMSPLLTGDQARYAEDDCSPQQNARCDHRQQCAHG